MREFFLVCCLALLDILLKSSLHNFQVVIVPIWRKTDEKTGVMNAAISVKDFLHTAGIRVKIDDTDQKTPGWKFNFWEMKVIKYSKD